MEQNTAGVSAGRELTIRCKYDELVQIKELKPHPKNRNIHPEDQIERLADILRYQGIRAPVVVSRLSGLIVKGHGTTSAIRKAGGTVAPVVYQDFDDETQEYAFLQSDNAIAAWADLDLSAINSDIGDFGPDFDIDLLGIKDFVLEPAEKFEAQSDEDEVPEAGETRAKRGDVWQLGKHRLMCGDSTAITDVEKLMPESADMTFTSPPYNAAKNSHLNGRVAGFDNKYADNSDAMSDDDYRDFLKEFTAVALAKSKYVFVNLQLLAHNRVPLIEYQNANRELLKDILIWNKTQCPPNIVKGAFNTKFEFIFCFSSDQKTRGFPCQWQGKYPNVVETESNSGNEFADTHKAGFPVSLPVWFLDKFEFAQSVFDPFGGTGTTIIACEKTNRRCFMMEIDPHYCDVILARWENYTGKTAERIIEGA